MSIQSAQTEAENGATALLVRMSDFEKRAAMRIAEIMATIETKGGKIVQSEANLARVAGLIAEMQATFIDDEMVDAVSDYLETFDAVGADVIAYMDGLGDLDTGLLEAVSRQYKQAMADYILAPETYSGTMWHPIANTLLFGVASGALLSNTVRSVGTIVTGSTEADTQGAVTMETQGSVESTPTMLQRTQTTIASDKLGVEFFRYQGRSIDTTRPFCKARAGKVFHRKEIEEWGRRAAAGDGWDGMVEGTNAQSIFVYLGGWYGKSNNCRHMLVPLARRDVPREDLDRMAEMGLLG